MKPVLYATATETRVGADHFSLTHFFCDSEQLHTACKTTWQAGLVIEQRWYEAQPCNGTCKVWLAQELFVSPLSSYAEMHPEAFFEKDHLIELGIPHRHAISIRNIVWNEMKDRSGRWRYARMRELLSAYSDTRHWKYIPNMGQMKIWQLVDALRAAKLPPLTDSIGILRSDLQKN
jgi:hypothetical protein